MYHIRPRGIARKLLLTVSAAALVTLGQPAIKAAFSIPSAAAQGQTLPKPFVSRAVDATLMELTPAVRSTFGIEPSVRGVFVLSTDPTGIAAQNGIFPGDVITDIRGRRVMMPIDVDTHVLYYLKRGDNAFQFAGNRGGGTFSAAAQITLALFDAVIDLATLASWRPYSYGSFSYTEYYAEYSSVIIEEYSYSEILIEETIESSSFESEMTSEIVTEETTITEEISEETTGTEETSEETSVEDESSVEAETSETEESAEEEVGEAADEADEPEEEQEADEPDDSSEDDSGDD